MTVTVSGRTFIITGSGRGLGRGYALELASRGANIVVNDLGTAISGAGSDATVATSVVNEIRTSGGSAVASGDDAASPEGARALVELALSEFGELHGIVANAGIIQAGTPFPDLEDAVLDSVVRTNLYGPWHLARAAWPHLSEQSFGRIVLVTSSAGIYGMTGSAAYAVTKAATIGLTRTLAQEGAPVGILVNAISPHAWSRMATGVEESSNSPEISALKSRVPIAAVAPAATVLLSDELRITGRILSVGGGHVGRVFLGETRGFSTSPALLSAEQMADNLARVDDTADSVVADSAMDAFDVLIGRG
jgi:NAD(P)-dependent dehydrogenase (short-subunit alcohol dehydrogenase family)